MVERRNEMVISAEWRRALRVVARCQDGCTEATLLAYGYTISMLAGLVLDRFATATPETLHAGRPIKVVRARITDAGRLALAE
jgi:hypothetical protein